MVLRVGPPAPEPALPSLVAGRPQRCTCWRGGVGRLISPGVPGGAPLLVRPPARVPVRSSCLWRLWCPLTHVWPCVRARRTALPLSLGGRPDARGKTLAVPAASARRECQDVAYPGQRASWRLPSRRCRGGSAALRAQVDSPAVRLAAATPFRDRLAVVEPFWRYAATGATTPYLERVIAPRAVTPDGRWS